jgi:hypothetical protein
MALYFYSIFLIRVRISLVNKKKETSMEITVALKIPECQFPFFTLTRLNASWVYIAIFNSFLSNASVVYRLLRV